MDDAIKLLQTLTKNNAPDREIQMAVGQIYLQAKRFADAEAALRKALELSPTQEDQEYPLFLLGSVFERQKRRNNSGKYWPLIP